MMNSKTLTFCAGILVTMCMAAAVAGENTFPDYQTLADVGLKPLPWCGYTFVFQPYGGDNWKEGSYSARFAHEADVQKLLTPVWNDPNYWNSHGMPGLHEWGTRPSRDGHAGNKREWHESFRQWYLTKKAERLKDKSEGTPFMSMTGHSWFSPYSGEWGCDLLGLEIGENIIATQGQFAFLRGTARHHGLPVFIDVSQWFSGYVPHFKAGEDEFTPHGPAQCGVEDWHLQANRFNGGHSPSLLARLWLVSWFSGASVVVPEACQANFFAGNERENAGLPKDQRMVLSPVGKRAQAFYSLTQRHPDIGIPYAPFALLLDRYAGYQGFQTYQSRPWNVLEPTGGDVEITRFMDTVFPGSMHTDLVPGINDDEWNNPHTEHRRLVASPYGDSFDGYLTTVPLEKLVQYPVVICLGDHEFQFETLKKLSAYLAQGGRLFLTRAQADRLGDKLPALRQAGRVELYTINDVPQMMAALTEQYVPVRVIKALDDPAADYRHLRVGQMGYPDGFRGWPLHEPAEVQYIINRTKAGWVICLVNNNGVYKGPATPVVVDPLAKKRVRLELKGGEIRSAVDWWTDKPLSLDGNSVVVDVEPGEVRIVELHQ